MNVSHLLTLCAALTMLLDTDCSLSQVLQAGPSHETAVIGTVSVPCERLRMLLCIENGFRLVHSS